MSYFLKEGSRILFGSSAIHSMEPDSRYICTLCLDCVEKSTGEQSFVDLHLTSDQLVELLGSVHVAIGDFIP